MPIDPGRKQQTHERIVDTAAGVLRSGGFQGVGVADVMQRAGLTHGGFYAHFASREALLAEALGRAGQDSRGRLLAHLDAAQAKGRSRFRALVDAYLHPSHLASPESGCPVAALASEMPRQAGEVRQAAVERVQSLVALVHEALGGTAAAREAAGRVAAQLVGALQLARTLGDNAQGRALLASTRRDLLERHAPADRAH